MTKALMILLAAAAAWACAGDASPSTTALIRDSAGVRIVEHPASFAADTWHLATTPSLRIGAEEGANSLDRVEGAHQLSDGRVVVANRGTRQLKYFDSQGNLLHNAAREGEGPGELSWISWSVTCGTDSVYVWDPFLARLSVFGPSGGFARSVNLRLEDNTPPTGDATCDDGMILMQRRVPLPRQAGPRRDRVGLVLFDLDGRLVYDLGEFPGPERYFWANPEGTGGTDGKDRPSTIPLWTDAPKFTKSVKNGKRYIAGSGNDTFHIAHLYSDTDDLYDMGYALGQLFPDASGSF